MKNKGKINVLFMVILGIFFCGVEAQRFGTSKNFTPYNNYHIIEGQMSQFDIGFLRYISNNINDLYSNTYCRNDNLVRIII